MNSRIGAVLAALVLCASTGGAQRPARRNPNPNRNPSQNQHQKPNRSGGQGQDKRRLELEQQFRQKGEQLVRQRLNLSADQLSRLRDVNARLDTRRRALLQQERGTRIALRQELARGDAADQPRVAQLMGQTQQLQQQRLQLQQDEQHELSTFLTPVQQAQYFGLQQQLRQRMRAMRQQQIDSAPPNMP